MKTKILTLLTIFVLLVATVPAMAEDKTVTIKHDVKEPPVLTTFSLTNQALNFTGTKGIDSVPADTNPWASINNTGSVNQTIKMTYPGSIPVKIGTVSGSGSAILVGTNTEIIANLEKAVPTSLYGWANFSSANVGVTFVDMTVNSTASGTP